MRKSKIMKALLVFGMSVVTATTMAGLVACSDNGGDSGNGGGNGGGQGTTHTHTWSDWTSVDGTNHKRECTAEGHEGEKTETAAHSNVNNKCPDCGYQFTGSQVNPGLTQTLIKAEDLDTNLAIGASLGNGLKIANKATTVETGDSEYTSYFNGEALTLTSKINLGGTINGSSGAQACIEVTATTATTLYVYAYSGGNTDRSLALYETSTPTSGTKFIEGTSQSIGNGTGTALGVAKFTIGAGETRYIGSTGSGINIYAIGVVTGGTVTETVKDSVPAKASTCTETGIKAHWISNYGVYYTNQGLTAVSSIPGLVTDEAPHTYANGKCSVCGRDENAAITKIDFNKLLADNPALYDVNATFNTSWLKVTAKGTSTYKSGGLSTKGSKLEITVDVTSTLSINYFSTSDGRKFTIKDSSGQGYGDGTPTYVDSKDSSKTYTQAAGEYHASKHTNKTVVLELTPGTYTITFDAQEHKVGWISCEPVA